jgi:CBS domain-containing protein
MNLEEAINFLKVSPPFQDLDQAVLKELMDTIIEESYPRGTVINDPVGPTGASLRIIKKGAVKVTVPFGRNEEALIDYRGEGQIFGFLSLLTGQNPLGEIITLEDTSCYRVDRETVLRLLHNEPAFARQFFTTFLNKYVDKPHRELGKRKLFYGGGDRLLFTTPVGELARRALVTAPEDISIREATEIMAKNQISSLILLNPLGLPAGIITNKDLRDKVVSKGRDTGQPVKKIQSVSLVKAEAGEPCIEALFKMIHYNIHHLLVLDNGRVKGIITAHDLMKLQGASPISIVREIEERLSLEGLASPVRKIQDLVGTFLREGVKSAQILRIITEIHDRLLRRMIELIEKRLGPPPRPYCFLSLGESGRKEQAFLDAQDWALLYADSPSPAEEKESKDYFLRFSSLVRQTLEGMGLSPAPEEGADEMPLRCRSRRSWEETFSQWIDRATPRSMEACLGFFDFRCLYGEASLADQLREAIRIRLRTGQDFIDTMALAILKTSPPLSAFRNFVVEKSGAFQGHFDLKRKGIKPLVDILRLQALENGLKDTATLERIQALGTASPLIRDFGQELEYAFELIFGLWLQHRHDQVRQGLPLHPYLNPERLNNLEKKALREAFSLVSKVQGLILEKHRPLKY